MNPIFILLVFLAALLLWFLLSFVFLPVGNLVYKIIKDAFDIMNKDNKNEKEKKE